ncbi:MAG TPA: DUF934 domain-containing protein [Burkholderiales bacterium]
MALIKDRKLACDSWQLLEAGANGALPSMPPTGAVIVPLAVWRVHRNELIARGGRLGISLAGSDEPAGIASDLQHLQLIAVRFESFTDGRGYSIARLLRERHGWRGELRAIGDVQRDQLYYLARCGFDAFVLREGEDVETAISAFNDFSEAYQTAVDRPVPLFRRREAETR